MTGKSNIEWTGHTWNPFAGCAVLSPGCTNCYAMKMAARLDAMGQPLYKGLTKPSNAGPVWRGTVRASPHALLAPLRRKTPTTYFVNSMSDLFYEVFDDSLIDQVFAVMALCPQHTFQVLTKRAERMRNYFVRLEEPGSPRYEIQHQAYCLLLDLHGDDAKDMASRALEAVTPWPLPNVWLGVSTERQKEYDERWPHLASTPAAVRFISYEPALGPLNLQSMALTLDHPIKMFPDWVICGGESGPDARPMHPSWARALRDQCALIGVPFFFKQWGAWAPSTPEQAAGNPRSGWCTLREHPRVAKAEELYPETGAAFIEHFGKKAAGRLLDGVTHDDMPLVSQEKHDDRG